MSDLQRAFAKAKLAGLPYDPPLPMTLTNSEEEEIDDNINTLPTPVQEDDSSSASSASSASSTGTIKPSLSKHLFARQKGSSATKRPLEPLPWSDFFSREVYLENKKQTETIIHHAYIIPPNPKGPMFVTHHGAGSSGLSFAVFASEIRKILPDAGILSLDARGHGETILQHPVHGDLEPSNSALDLSLETLSQDLLDVILLTQRKLAWSELPGLLLVGHSLGGAVITDVAASGKLGNAVLGYAVLDVVEGSAIDALHSMQSYLSTRPLSFPSLAAGIEWHTRTRTLRNPLSARVSVPSLLRPSPTTPLTWLWRTDLASTQPYWESWFRGLSRKFLSAKGGKLLLLAGTDRLDKELMIGQMQGKYQLGVFPEAGHFVQEDAPEKTAGAVADFYRRNDRSLMVLPGKVGEGGLGVKK